MTWTVYVASYKRPGLVTTDRVVRGCKIVVPESQLEEYKKFEYYNDAEVISLPDKSDGNLCKKRNWILDNTETEDLVILDDDYSYIGHVEESIAWKCSLDQIDDLLGNGFQMCRDLGTAMWGINQQVDPKFYREYSPFSMLSPILGPFQAFTDTPLRYDEDLWLKEDYDLYLQHIHKYHRTLRFNKYHYMVDHLSKIGGQVSNRTRDEEVRQLVRLREKWGSSRVSFNLRRSINPRVRVPYRGI